MKSLKSKILIQEVTFAGGGGAPFRTLAANSAFRSVFFFASAAVRHVPNGDGEEATAARQSLVQPAEDGAELRGLVRREAGQGSLPGRLPGVDAGDRPGGPAGQRLDAADGRDGDVHRPGREKRPQGEAVFISRYTHTRQLGLLFAEMSPLSPNPRGHYPDVDPQK